MLNHLTECFVDGSIVFIRWKYLGVDVSVMGTVDSIQRKSSTGSQVKNLMINPICMVNGTLEGLPMTGNGLVDVEYAAIESMQSAKAHFSPFAMASIEGTNLEFAGDPTVFMKGRDV